MKKQIQSFYQYFRILIVGWLFIIPSYSQIAVAELANLELRHDPVPCTVTGLPLKVQFKVNSPNPLEEARIYFKTRNAKDFYYIHAEAQNAGLYVGMLPGPMSAVKNLEYRILVVDDEGQAIKSPVFHVMVKDKSECPQFQSNDLRSSLIVSAEREIQPGIGFSGNYIIWHLLKETFGKAYLNQADEVSVQPYSIQDKIRATFKNLRIGKKTALGLGAGLGTAALIGIIAGSDESKEKSIWDPIDDVAENVTAELIKTPEIQTTCGTVVTNQLFVTNNGIEDLLLGTIDYEIILTRDKPAGSCELGRTGAFAPNLETVVPPGVTLLIREWMNEVNPCYGCPYVIAECQWESRYVVHTSAGTAIAFTKFTSKGDLCGTPAAKSCDGKSRIRGDVEP